MFVRFELEQLEKTAGPNVVRDFERAIQALIDDAVARVISAENSR